MFEVDLIVIEWLFFAYMSYQIGNRLNIKKSYPWYIIPLWNFWILGQKSEVRIKEVFFVFVMILIFVLVFIYTLDPSSDDASLKILSGADEETSLFIANHLAPPLLEIFPLMALLIIKFIGIPIFWGGVAQKMGKEYGVYVLLGLFSIYLPPLLLAFEKIDKLITHSSIYSPLSKEAQKLLVRENSIPIEKMNRVISIGVLLLILLSVVYTFNL